MKQGILSTISFFLVIGVILLAELFGLKTFGEY